MRFSRLRKFRRNGLIRDLVAETKLRVDDFIMPYFVVEGKDRIKEIKSMSGIHRLSVDRLIKDIYEARALGIKAVLLFGLSSKKDESGTSSYARTGALQKAVRTVKGSVKDMVVFTDVCLCGYTSHGHCGIVKNKSVDNDETIKILVKIALSHAEAGADFVAPSAMMDGQVRALREALDEGGFKDTGILAYSAKYASNFYGPFREAMESAPRFGDRKTYQMDYRNSDEAMREIEEDIREGADIVMVKPALAYLDIIRRAKDNFNVPIAAYNVSGEYAMVKEYARGSDKELILEILTAIKRAGADLIITYHAKEMARWGLK